MLLDMSKIEQYPSNFDYILDDLAENDEGLEGNSCELSDSEEEIMIDKNRSTSDLPGVTTASSSSDSDRDNSYDADYMPFKKRCFEGQINRKVVAVRKCRDVVRHRHPSSNSETFVDNNDSGFNYFGSELQPKTGGREPNTCLDHKDRDMLSNRTMKNVGRFHPIVSLKNFPKTLKGQVKSKYRAKKHCPELKRVMLEKAKWHLKSQSKDEGTPSTDHLNVRHRSSADGTVHSVGSDMLYKTSSIDDYFDFSIFSVENVQNVTLPNNSKYVRRPYKSTMNSLINKYRSRLKKMKLLDSGQVDVMVSCVSMRHFSLRRQVQSSSTNSKAIVTHDPKSKVAIGVGPSVQSQLPNTSSSIAMKRNKKMISVSNIIDYVSRKQIKSNNPKSKTVITVRPQNHLSNLNFKPNSNTMIGNENRSTALNVSQHTSQKEVTINKFDTTVQHESQTNVTAVEAKAHLQAAEISGSKEYLDPETGLSGRPQASGAPLKKTARILTDYVSDTWQISSDTDSDSRYPISESDSSKKLVITKDKKNFIISMSEQQVKSTSSTKPDPPSGVVGKQCDRKTACVTSGHVPSILKIRNDNEPSSSGSVISVGGHPQSSAPRLNKGESIVAGNAYYCGLAAGTLRAESEKQAPEPSSYDSNNKRPTVLKENSDEEIHGRSGESADSPYNESLASQQSCKHNKKKTVNNTIVRYEISSTSAQNSGKSSPQATLSDATGKKPSCGSSPLVQLQNPSENKKLEALPRMLSMTTKSADSPSLILIPITNCLEDDPSRSSRVLIPIQKSSKQLLESSKAHNHVSTQLSISKEHVSSSQPIDEAQISKQAYSSNALFENDISVISSSSSFSPLPQTETDNSSSISANAPSATHVENQVSSHTQPSISQSYELGKSADTQEAVQDQRLSVLNTGDKLLRSVNTSKSTAGCYHKVAPAPVFADGNDLIGVGILLQVCFVSTDFEYGFLDSFA